MADLHQLNIPINKDSTWLWDTMDRWLQQPINECNWSQDISECDPLLTTNNLLEETCWLKKHLTKLRSPVVFCHNDLQEGNILMKESESGCRSLCLIDYEYCAYNYRGFDIANHFVEWTYDYTNPIYPYYSVNRELFPTKDQQTLFLEKYSQCMGGEESIEVLLNEVRHFILASHLFWGIWSIINSRTSKITFGYREYAKERIKSYYKLKDCLTNNNNT